MIPLGNMEIAMNMKELGEFIAAERRRQGVTQLQLSQAADVGRRFVVEVEVGKETVQTGKLLKVLDALGVSIALTSPEGV